LAWAGPAYSANITSTWIGSTGNWSDPTKWSNSPTANTFPRNGNLGNTYDVTFDSTSFQQPNLDVDVALNNLTLTNSGLISTTSNRSLTVANAFTFYAGRLGVPMTIPAGGQLRFGVDPRFKSISNVITLGGTTLLGDTSFAYPFNSISTYAYGAGAGIKILPTGVFTIDREFRLITTGNEGPPIGGHTSGTLDNAGLIDQRAGVPFRVGAAWEIVNSGTMRVDGPFRTDERFSNTGLFELKSGSASAELGFGGTISGTVRLAAGSTLTFKGVGLGFSADAVPHLLSNVSFGNAGTISLGGGGLVKVATPLTIPGAFSIATSSARLVLGAATSLTGPAVFDGGAIGVAYGSDPGPTNRVTATDFTFKSGTLDRTELSIPAGGVLTLSGGGNRRLMDSKVIVGGVANWSAGSFDVVPVAGGTTRSTLQILAGGTLNVPPSAAVNFITSGGILNNAGLINIDRGALSNGGGWPVLNSGTIRVTAGAIRLGESGMTNGGRIELVDGGAMAVINGNVTSVRAKVASGTIYSSSAQAEPSTTIAVAHAVNVYPFFQEKWRGLTIDSGDVLVVHTKFGDSNMDGRVDFADLVRVAQRYESTSFGSGWGDGDFNYDGKVNFADLVRVAQNYDSSVGGAAVPGASADFAKDVAAAFASVPEPGTATGAALLLAGCGAVRRRRRHQHI
jgi:hypothetical protein